MMSDTEKCVSNPRTATAMAEQHRREPMRVSRTTRRVRARPPSRAPPLTPTTRQVIHPFRLFVGVSLCTLAPDWLSLPPVAKSAYSQPAPQRQVTALKPVAPASSVAVTYGVYPASSNSICSYAPSSSYSSSAAPAYSGEPRGCSGKGAIYSGGGRSQ